MCQSLCIRMWNSSYLFICIILYFYTNNSSKAAEYSSNEQRNWHRLYSLSGQISGLSENWDTLGNTLIINNYVRLTPDARSQKGSIWSKHPCNLKFWQVDIHFKVQGVEKGLFGDGMAFWYTKDRMQEGPVYGGKDYFAGLAIIADTYSNHNGPHNHEHPYVSAMVNNGTLHYDHDRDGTHTQLAGCTSKFRNQAKSIMRIIYNLDTIEVYVTLDGLKWDKCFAVSGVILPTGYYFGMSASTGDLSDAHQVHSIYVYDLTTLESTEDRSNLSPSASVFEAPRDHVDDPKPSTLSAWKKVFLLIFGVAAICGCVFIGGLFYSQQQENRRKRFY